MSKRVIGFLVFGGLMAIFVYTLLQSSNTGEDPEVYQQRIEFDRYDKDKTFKAAEDSPIPEEERSSFKGLKYYPIKHEYRINARLEQNPLEEHMQIQTSTGTAETYKRWGWAHFQLNNQPLKLLILQSTDGTNHLFVPFADETSARETYGAGRYLEVPDPEGNKIVLDFNQAYNPYCAYNERYTCPLPPKENILPVAIEAGEKSYEK
ncbi:DUF1684 domain-containing protein [Cesiribacter sp. SM1]|uniref:DUF1684 domain-containing protein n=1 Tax=Cesiribacter sp. SM1 TaxID=2861196 RepID=UPI001CD1AA0F|nr:DUF1684 domain-containing protein [Cesiribacter sp. SM1]